MFASAASRDLVTWQHVLVLVLVLVLSVNNNTSS